MVAPLIVGAARVVGGTAAKQSGKRAVRKVGKGRYHLQSYKTNKSLQRRTTEKKATSTLQRIFRQNNEVLDESEAQLLTETPPKQPDFPFLIVGLAALKDLLDIPLELTLIGIVFTTAFSCMIAITLFFWCFGKAGGGWWKKRLIRWLWNRYILAIILEFIPFIKMVPVTTLFILMVHYKEKKLVKLANQGLEELKRLGFLSLAR